MFFDECFLEFDLESILGDWEKLQNWTNGYTCGLTWPDLWESHGKPGGPWVSPNRPETLEYNKLWRDGWEKGHEAKLVSGTSFTVEEHNHFYGPKT